jgi:hypothetical protein
MNPLLLHQGFPLAEIARSSMGNWEISSGSGRVLGRRFHLSESHDGHMSDRHEITRKLVYLV